MILMILKSTKNKGGLSQETMMTVKTLFSPQKEQRRKYSIGICNISDFLHLTDKLDFKSTAFC
jgi:hypothetical protein